VRGVRARCFFGGAAGGRLASRRPIMTSNMRLWRAGRAAAERGSTDSAAKRRQHATHDDVPAKLEGQDGSESVWKDGCMPHQVASRAHGAHCSWALDPGSGGMSVDRNTTIAHANLPTYERSTILSPGEWGCETPTNAILVVRDAGRLSCSINSNSLKSNSNKVTMHLHLGIRQYNLNQRVTCSQLFPQSPQE
jgi:hypothetical protein